MFTWFKVILPSDACGTRSRVSVSLYGYIRRIEKKHKQLIIPPGIKQICLDYFEIHEYFASNEPKIKVNKQRNILQGTDEIKGGEIALANELINPSDHSILRYQWRFKLWDLDRVDIEHPALGLLNTNKGKDSYFMVKYPVADGMEAIYESGDPNYDIIDFYVVNKKKKRKNKKYKTEDTYYIHYLQCNKNGGFVHSMKIDGNQTYEFCVSLRHKSQKVELVDFQIVYDKDYGKIDSTSTVKKYIHKSRAIFQKVSSKIF